MWDAACTHVSALAAIPELYTAADFAYCAVQAEKDVNSLLEQVSQLESRNTSPSKRRASLTQEEMGTHLNTCLLHSLLPWLICCAEAHFVQLEEQALRPRNCSALPAQPPCYSALPTAQAPYNPVLCPSSMTTAYPAGCLGYTC